MSREFYFRGIDDLLHRSGSEVDKLLVNREGRHFTARFQSQEYGTIATEDVALALTLRKFSKRVAELRIEELSNEMDKEERKTDRAQYKGAIHYQQNILFVHEAEVEEQFLYGTFIENCLHNGLWLSAFIAPYTNCKDIRLGIAVPDSNHEPKIWIGKPTFLEAYEALHAIEVDSDWLKLVTTARSF